MNEGTNVRDGIPDRFINKRIQVIGPNTSKLEILPKVGQTNLDVIQGASANVKEGSGSSGSARLNIAFRNTETDDFRFVYPFEVVVDANEAVSLPGDVFSLPKKGIIQPNTQILIEAVNVNDGVTIDFAIQIARYNIGSKAKDIR